MVGVQLVFAQRSRVFAFDFRTMLLTLVSGMALLSTAKTITDLSLMYVLPHRRSYRLFVQKLTPDMDPDTDAERAVLRDMLAAKRRKLGVLKGEQTISSTAAAAGGSGSDAFCELNDAAMAAAAVAANKAEAARLARVLARVRSTNRVPYAASSLTRLLSEALGGSSLALFIACANPGGAVKVGLA